MLPRETDDLPEETEETEERGVLFLLDMTLQIQITLMTSTEDWFVLLTLFAPAYLSASKDQGGAYCPPFVLWVWFGLEFQIFLEITCLGMFYHIQKDS